MKRKTWRRNLNSRNREGKGVKGWGGLLNYSLIITHPPPPHHIQLLNPFSIKVAKV